MRPPLTSIGIEEGKGSARPAPKVKLRQRVRAWVSRLSPAGTARRGR